ncbi:MAG: DegT/DnrJ/EryC1/StrS family aminotransferase [Deltaproteobacteria bacterium]|nr:DegT/DnrJ/EryC1/StrS family aminotransferase [Deltaproteobacteria bacterium]
MISCGNPKAQYIAYKAEIDEVINRVLNRGWYILGEETSDFEKEFSHYIGVQYSIGVGSGTEALHLALAACEVSRGDEVITVSHTAVATVAAIELVGAHPVFVDIEPDYYTMNPYILEEVITPRTKAIIPVHIYGQPANLEPILEISRRHNLYVIEDCAQAHGAMYKGEQVGSWGDIGCFSFYPTKNLGAIGDGGIIVTDNKALADKARLLREYGWMERFKSDIPGWNSRLDEIQSAILRVKLKHLEKDNEMRRRWAALYMEELKTCDLALPKVRSDSTHVYHQFVVHSSRRNALQKFLGDRGIGAQIHYPMAVHQQPAYCNRLGTSTGLSVTERAVKEILSLPIYPELTKSEMEKIIGAVRAFFS